MSGLADQVSARNKRMAVWKARPGLPVAYSFVHL